MPRTGPRTTQPSTGIVQALLRTRLGAASEGGRGSAARELLVLSAVPASISELTHSIRTPHARPARAMRGSGGAHGL